MHKLTFHRRIRRWYVLPVLAAVVAAVAFGLASTSVHSAAPPAPVLLTAVPPSVLLADGISLTQPNTASGATATAQAAATTAAQQQLNGNAVEEIKYAHCSVTNEAPPVNEDCWVVSLDPSGFTSHGPEGSTPIPATYLVALVDPNTDNVILAEAGKP
jgi:hypothetical protein